MKCLSVAQPMASAIFLLPDGIWKSVENRSRDGGARPSNILNHRGPLLIQASSTWVPEHWEWLRERRLAADLVEAFAAATGREVVHGDYGREFCSSLKGELPTRRILGVVDVAAEVWPSGLVYADPKKVGTNGLALDSEDKRWWMGGYGLIFADRRAFPWFGRTRFKDDPPAMWPGLNRSGALGIFNVPDQVAGGPARCEATRVVLGVGMPPRCVFGVGHTCPHASAEGFGWT